MVGGGEIDLVHDQELVVSETRIGVDVGLTRRFGVSVVLPVRVVSTSIRYLDTSGNEVELVRPGIHHRNETVSGLADPMVLGSVGTTFAGMRWSARGGLTIPIGATEEDPFALGDMGVAHQHIQMGTGTFNPVVALDVARAWGPWRLGGFAFTQQVLYENGKGYHAGDRYAGGVMLRRGLGAWGVRGGVEFQAETAERWSGVVHTNDGNRGRIDAMLAAGGSWAATRALTVDLTVKVPVVTHVVGGQLDMPSIVELGASWSFGRPKEIAADDHDHDHDHDHGHGHDEGEHAEGDHHDDSEPGDDHEAPPFIHPDTTGLDVADLSPPGAAVELAPVPGKITIFDFWATWCEPCKVLEPALVEIVRAHPDRVALRRVDAVDWDSAGVARYLTPGGHNLPHLKVYDASGKLVLERSPTPGKLDALIDDVRQIVEPKAAVVEAPPPPPAKPVRPRPVKPVRVRIAVTDKGFEPANVTVPRGVPVILTFERQTNRTCATEVVFRIDGKRTETKLPLGVATEVRHTFAKPGPVTYACAMDMITGTVTVR